MLEHVERSLAVEPLLDAFQQARGSIVDLDRGTVVTSDELRRAAADLVGTFRSRGLSAGDRVVMAIGNGPSFPAAIAGVLGAGGSPILLHAESPPPELTRAAVRFGARFILTDSGDPAALADLGYPGDSFTDGWFGGLWARAVESPEIPDTGPLVAVPLHPTSGTTGEPRIAVRPGAAAVSEARHYIDTIEIESDDTVLCHIPMSHAYGFGMGFMVPLLSGATLLTMRRLNGPGLLKGLTGAHVSVYPSVPAALDLLLLTSIESSAIPRCITSAGAPLPARVAKLCNQRWGASVRPLYGTTETGGISVARPDHDPEMTNSVGPAMDGVELRLDELPGDDPSAVQVGQLWVKSGSMMAGYVSPTGIDDTHVAGGWFNTGDLATIDPTGNILLRGRASETINVFGHKVLPSEVEEVISMLPGVREVKVYSAPNRWGSNWLKAAVVADAGLISQDVAAHCRAHLVSYKQPEAIEMLDQLPKSPSGKVVVSRLP